MRKTRKMHGNKHKTRSRRGGVRVQASRATTLQQALRRLTKNSNASHPDVLRNILAQEPPRDRLRAITRMEEAQDQHHRNLALQEVLEKITNQPGNDVVSYIFSLESPRQQARARARMAANAATAAIQADDRRRMATLENLLGKTYLADPDLVRRLQRQSLAGPSQHILENLRESGTARRNYNQELFDKADEIRRENKRLYREAMRRRYPHIDLNNIPPFLPLPPHRQHAERNTPFDRLP